MELFYNPQNAVVGDVIPFYDNGQFKPFYLRGSRGYFGDDAFSGWTMLTTNDHLHFTEAATGIQGGTGSVVLALTLMGKVSGQDVTVSVPGGELRVTIDRDCEAVKAIWLTGPTNLVCEGEVQDEDLHI